MIVQLFQFTYSQHKYNFIDIKYEFFIKLRKLRQWLFIKNPYHMKRIHTMDIIHNMLYQENF